MKKIMKKRRLCMAVLCVFALYCLAACAKGDGAGSAGSSAGAESTAEKDTAETGDGSGKSADSGAQGQEAGGQDAGNQEAGEKAAEGADGAGADGKVTAGSEYDGSEFPLEKMGRIELCDYSEIPVTMVKVEEPTEEDIEEYIADLLYDDAVEVADRPVQDGDIVTIDFSGTINGSPFDGGEGEDFDLRVGSDSFIEGFEGQLTGHSIGETFDIFVTFPEDYYDEDVAGKDAIFETTVKAIRQPAALTEELVAKYTESGSVTVEEFKSEIRERLLTQNSQDTEDNIGFEALTFIISNSVLEPSDEYISWQTGKNKVEFLDMLELMGESLEDYLAENDITEEDLDSDFRQSAENLAVYGMAYAKIAADQGITVNDEVMQRAAAYYGRLFGNNDYTVNDFSEEYGEDNAKQLAFEHAVEEYLAKHASVSYVSSEDYYAEFDEDEEDLEGEDSEEAEDAEADAEADGESEADADEEAETEADVEADGESEADANVDAEAEAGTDAEDGTEAAGDSAENAE